MMTREQRIEYEILDCAFNADSVSAYITDTQTFTQLLSGLFPDIRPEEFIAACKRLVEANRLDIQYRGYGDELTVFEGRFHLVGTALSHSYFEELRRLIEVPTYRKVHPQ